ncbi:MAG: substrate-binding domain-containing protein, partial [Desulfobacteraceae bacterium]
MNVKTWGIAASILLAAIFSMGFTKQDTSKIRVKGSTTVDPISRKLANAYQSHKKIKIEVDSTGSHSGLDALISGECDIAESSSEASPEYIAKAEKVGVVLKAFLIAHDYILPIVHPKNKATDISIEQLHDIYTGKITSWESITNQKTPMVVVSRDETSGTGDVWKDVLGIDGDILADKDLQKSNSGVLAF